MKNAKPSRALTDREFKDSRIFKTLTKNKIVTPLNFCFNKPIFRKTYHRKFSTSHKFHTKPKDLDQIIYLLPNSPIISIQHPKKSSLDGNKQNKSND